MSPLKPLLDGLFILFILGVAASFSGLVWEALFKAMTNWRSRRRKLISRPQKHRLERP
jgi:hypothetical protein